MPILLTVNSLYSKSQRRDSKKPMGRFQRYSIATTPVIIQKKHKK